MSKSIWIGGASADVVFIFSFLWFAPVLFYFAEQPLTLSLSILLPFTILLSQGHKYSPAVLLLASSAARAHVLRQRPKIYKELALIIFAPIIISAASVFYYHQAPLSKQFYIPVSILGFGFTIWTYFHFSQQNYGIVKLYRNLNIKQSDKLLDKVDHCLVIAVTFFLTAVVCTFSNERLGFYLYFSAPLKMPENLRAGGLGICFFLYLGLLFLYSKRKALNVSTFLGASHYFVITMMVCVLPIYLGLLLLSVSRTQAIYLASVLLCRDNATARGRKKMNLAIVIVSFFLLSTISFALYKYINTNLAVPDSFGNAVDFSKYESKIVMFGLLYFGLNVGLNYSHFYLDRFIYRKNFLLRQEH